jgi:hypothetical protein
MPKTAFIDTVGRALRDRGLPREYISRAVREVSEHLEDLRAEAGEQGLSFAGAADYATRTLGDPQRLAAELAESLQQATWYGRHPVLGFGLLPVALFTGLFLWLLVLGTLIGGAAGWWAGTVSATGRTLLTIAIHSVHYGLLLGIPALVGWWARRSCCGLRPVHWSVLGLMLHGLFHQLNYSYSTTGRGSLVWGYALHWDILAIVLPFLGFAVFRGLTAVLATLLLAACSLGAAPGVPVATPETTMPRRVFTELLNPREYPDYERRAVKPPTWETFKNRTQFTCLRGFNVQDDRVVGYAEEIERFSRTFELGRVIWPSYPILFATNLADLADEIKKRDLYLFDIWGYVPGSGPGGYWQQFKPPPQAFTTLEEKLGERWLGTDIGEQDGRYIGGYADQMTPSSASRFEQYLNFQRHFERMSDDLGHKHATLVSLNYGHYFLKEGTYTLIGAETAQALPNNQVYYAFIRGAGKQYGVPWFGNASIYNRWGFKTYGSTGRSEGADYGPTKGTSLSLMKRLLYSHVLFNCVAVGFENGWFEGDHLSPIGRIQQAAQHWVEEHGQPGVMHTPVALLLDFFSGWTFPRHLYSDKVYRVWGNLPYEKGDFLTDEILGMLYPGYQNSSYFHDESGFMAPTPYGDIADCLLSDAPGWLLARYPVVVVAGEISGGRELRNKLQAYVEQGGQLALTAGNLARLPGGIGGIQAAPRPLTTNIGAGRLTLFSSENGVELRDDVSGPPRSEIDKSMKGPYGLSPQVREGLDRIFREQQLFDIGKELSLITCRKGGGEYTLGIANNTWRELPLKIVSHCGLIESVRELELDQSEKDAPGYLPEGVKPDALGRSREETIAGGDLRIFAVRVKESGVVEIPRMPPPARPRGSVLPLRQARSIKEEILGRPTFFSHFDGVAVDWRYVREREKDVLRQEAGWIQRQGLRVFVDLSSGLDLYPTLRLIDNLSADYASSMTTIADVLAKMEILGAKDLILSLHRYPENNFTGEQTLASFERSLRTLADQAVGRKVTLYLRMAPGKPPWSLGEVKRLLDRVGADNLRLAASTALLARTRKTPEAAAMLNEKLGLWLVAAPRTDIAGKMWDAHAPIAAAPENQSITEWLKLNHEVPRLLDAVYANPDQEYLDAVAIESLSR